MLFRIHVFLKISLLLIFIIISTVAFSQEKVVHFGVSFNAKITHQNFETAIFENGDSQDEFSYSVNGNVYFNLGNQFQLVSGVSFSKYVINLVDYRYIFLCDIDPSTGADVKNSYLRENYHTSYIGIPLELRWKIVGKKSNLFLQFGFEGLYKINVKNDRALYECGKKSDAPILAWPYYYTVNDFLLLSKMGIGYELQFNEKVKIFFMPNMEYSLTNFFDYGGDNSKFFNFGLNTGIKF